MTFRSLRHRNYRLYFFGQLVSWTGYWMQTTALMWLAYALTGQSAWAGLIGAAEVVPTFVLGAWGGALADRCPKRKLLFVTQSSLLALALVLAILVMAGQVTPWYLLIVSAAAGIVQAADLPARLAFVMEMVGRDDLFNAVALNSLLFNVARAVGPGLAGSVLVWLGPGPCFLANALSYVALLWALTRMDPDRAPAPPSGSKPGSLRAGLRYLANRPILGLTVLQAGAVAFFGWSFLVLLPGFAHRALGAGEEGYSWMLGAMGCGALAAALAVARFGVPARQAGFLTVGVLLIVGGLGGLALAGSLPVAVACCSLAGCGLIVFSTTNQTIVQLGARDNNRGLIMGIWAMLQRGAMPLGFVLAGPAADWWGERLVLSIQGIGAGASAAGLFLLFWLWKGNSASFRGGWS